LGRAFSSRTEGKTLAKGQRPRGADEKGTKPMASNRSKPPAKAQTRPALTFDIAVQLCPHQGMAEKVAETFGLIVPEYDAIREQHARALRSTIFPFGPRE
jgi:hypothetical protein